ncbi:MAG: LptF/LptG family permease [Flavobacteriales bacterium]|jgi:lipopolysaccharide export system permease protein|nr:LptF/LptG family permease [Flavobacteriales bacterium]
MLKTIDWYIIKKILKTFVFSLVGMLAIILVFDLSEKIVLFIDSNMTLWELITEYFIGFIVHIGNMFFPLFVLITVVLVTLKLNQRSEITAILSSGISFNRLLRPFFVGIGIIVAFSFLINFFFLPKANKSRMAFENKHTPYASVLAGVHFEVVPGTIVSYKNYNFREMRSVSEMWVDNFKKDENGKFYLASSLYANYAYGDSISQNFSLKNVTERYILPTGDSVLKYSTLDTTLPFGLKDLGQRNEVVSTMYVNELIAYRNKEKQKGSAIVPFIEIEIFARSANPLSLFILGLLGICMSISPARSKVGVTILLGILSVALYFVFNRFSTVYATNAGLNTFLAVWIPNFILLAFGIFLYIRTPK